MQQFKRAGLSVLSLGALRRITARVYSNVPVRNWPKLVGTINDLAIPRRVRPLPEPTAASFSNINIVLELLDRTASIVGAVAECGIWRGSTLVSMALYLQQQGSSRKVYGFDSFEGFGHAIERGEGGDSSAVAFVDTSLDLVARKVRLFGLDRVELIKGYFETSLESCDEKWFSFVHLDGDTYVAYRDCLRYFYPRLPPGAIVLLDEYDDPGWPGCNKAVDEFLADKPERLESICRDNYLKYYFVKE